MAPERAVSKRWGKMLRIFTRASGQSLRASAAAAIVVACATSTTVRAESQCATPPPAVTSLDVPRFYSDEAGSIVDPVLKAEHEKAVEPLTAFLRHVVADADRAYTRNSEKSQMEAAQCALTWLQTWAAADAWLGTMSTKQAEYQRKWDLGGVALAYLKLRPFSTEAQRLIIEPWLQKFADVAHAFFDDPEHKRNNHWYWLGLGEAAVGVATSSPRHFEIARGIMKDAAHDIAPNGTLPDEMARKGRALYYHVFALVPLVLMAELGAANGEDWYALENGALHRLVAVTLEGLAEPEKFDVMAGIKQERPINTRAEWLQAYQKRFPDRVKGDVPDVKESNRWLGGNVYTLLMALKR